MILLKAELKSRGQPVSGNKPALVIRLIEAIKTGLPVSSSAVEQRDVSMNALDVTAYWKPLVPDPRSVPEPVNEDSTLRPPTSLNVPVMREKVEFSEEL